MPGRSRSIEELRKEAKKLLELAKKKEEEVYTEVGKLALKFLKKKPDSLQDFFEESKKKFEAVNLFSRKK